MDFSVTPNRFAPLGIMDDGDIQALADGGGGFQNVKRRCVRPSPGVVHKFSEISIDEKLNVIYSDVQRMMDIQKQTNEGMTFLFNSVSCTNKNVDQVVKVTDQNIRMLRLLSYKSIDLEARARRNNLIFKNLMYKRGDDWFDVVRRFITDHLDLDGYDVHLERAHPFGPPSRNTGRRDIIVAFRNFADTEVVMRNVGALKGTPFVIDRDYPKEVVSARKRLWPRFKAAKANAGGKKVAIQFPARLVVNGEVVHDEFPNWFNYLSGDRDITLHRAQYESPPTSHTTTENNTQPVTNNVHMASPYMGLHSDDNIDRGSMRDMYGTSMYTNNPYLPPVPTGAPVFTRADTRKDTHNQTAQSTSSVAASTNHSDPGLPRSNTTSQTSLAVNILNENRSTPVQPVPTGALITTTTISSDTSDLSSSNAPSTSAVTEDSIWRPPIIQPSIFRSTAPANVPSATITTGAPHTGNLGSGSSYAGHKQPASDITTARKPRSPVRRNNTRHQNTTRSDSVPANLSRARGQHRGKRTIDSATNDPDQSPTGAGIDTGQSRTVTD